MIAFTIAAIIQ
jgi:hypothetical protein